MTRISNRFYVTALEDGTTLHGNLVVDGSLSQAWNGQAAVPDWTIAANQPLIYLTLLSGGTAVECSSTFTWRYNGTALTFDTTTGKSTNTGLVNVFQKTTKTYTYGGTSVTMPALRIIDNLANGGNTDVDLITFEGEYLINDTPVDFSATAQIRISILEAGSSLGVINFHNGISDITEKGQTIVAYGMLYNPDGTADNTVSTEWYLNDGSTPTSGATIQGHANAYQISEADVVDHATLRCAFKKGGTLLYTAYASVDDMQDPEFMYIQYNGNNGNAASLRKGETATFQIWVGTREDPTPLGGTTNPTYSVIKVKLLDGDGQVITQAGLATNIPDADASGYRTLPMSGGKATITPHYNTVNQVGKKNLTGIIIAEESSQSS